MESKGSKRNVLLRKELPFGEKILKRHLDLFEVTTTKDPLCISRQEFLKLLETNVNKQ